MAESVDYLRIESQFFEYRLDDRWVSLVWPIQARHELPELPAGASSQWASFSDSTDSLQTNPTALCSPIRAAPHRNLPKTVGHPRHIFHTVMKRLGTISTRRIRANPELRRGSSASSWKTITQFWGLLDWSS